MTLFHNLADRVEQIMYRTHWIFCNDENIMKYYSLFPFASLHEYAVRISEMACGVETELAV